MVFIGDGNNVAVSLMHVSAKLGWNFTIANPADYELNPQAVETAKEMPLSRPAAASSSCAIRMRRSRARR